MNTKEKVSLFEKIRNQDYELNKDQSAIEIMDIALSELGNLDPYIRDELALEVAAYMIYKGYLSDDELRDLAKRLLSKDFLFYGLESQKKDSVFVRTFTSLLIAMLFRVPDQDVALTDNELEQMYASYLDYLKSEYDYRGYVEEKGWAHFFAHSSDVLKYFFQEPSFDEKWVNEYLKTIKVIIQNDHYAFHHNEDERFKNAFMVLINRHDMDEHKALDFLGKLIVYQRTNTLPSDLIRFINVKNILREIFFAIDQTKYPHLKKQLEKLIEQHRVY